MGSLRSEVLLNRELLWLVMAYVGRSWIALVFLVPCAYNVWKSYETWGDEK